MYDAPGGPLSALLPRGRGRTAGAVKRVLGALMQIAMTGRVAMAIFAKGFLGHVMCEVVGDSVRLVLTAGGYMLARWRLMWGGRRD